MIGKTLGHYQITGLLGRGGMGEVYRALDTKLDREVALKVLPADVAADPARLERFQREAKTVAGLNHSHIVTLYSVEEADGVHFLTMEVVEGQGLDQVLTADGLPLAKVFDIGIAVADALAAAHEKGIVHRDLKPANVMIAKDGRVKVLDFGLAKLSDTSSSPDADTIAPITTEGAVMGTVPYMSPEQLRGQDVDHRSDIFSFGILLYEMASGRRPFTGPTNADVSSAILTATPAPITRLKPDLPEHLGRIIAQCLEKEPEERYQSAKDIRNELRGLRREAESGASQIHSTTGSSPAVSSATPARRSRKTALIGGITAAVVAALVATVLDRVGEPRKPALTDAANHDKTIAVLPFVNMSADPEQEYFSDGISEELLNMMAKIKGLRVAARTSSFSFKGKDVEIPEIAKRLNVAYVLEGSVRKSGEQVRITTQLIQAADGFHVWSETYDRKLDDIFAIQDDIAADVVKQLQITLLGDAPAVRKTDPEAYALYLKAAQLGRQQGERTLEQADSLLYRVLEIDSTYAPAWAQLGRNFANKANKGLMPFDEAFAQAKRAFSRAIELDPKYAAGHAGLGYAVMYGDDDPAGAAKHLERALALDPSDLSVLGNSSILLGNLGRLDEALALREAIARRDPLNPTAQYNLGTAQMRSGQLDNAITTFRIAVSLSPDMGVTHSQMAIAMLLKGDASGALAEFEAEPIEPVRMTGLPMAYHALGRKAESDAALAACIKAHADDDAYTIAAVYAYRGEPDKAFEWLERERQTINNFAEILPTPLFNSLHDDPRWLPFLRTIGKAPEQVDKIQFKVTLPNA